MNKFASICIVLACLLALSAAVSKTYTPADTNFATDLNSIAVGPGDVITFAASTAGGSATYDFKNFGGTYNFVGSANNPITIRARPGDKITFTTSDQYKNIIQLKGSNFLFTGFYFITTAPATGSTAVRLMPNTSNAVISNLNVKDSTTNPITANVPGGTYTNITFRNNIVDGTDDTAECFYVGCQASGGVTPACVISNSLFENNYCAHTCKSGNCGGSGGSGFQIKHGSYNNIVRNNVCFETNTPCVLLYDDYDKGVNIVEGNLIWNTKIDSGIQVSAGAVIRNNIIFGSGNDGITITSNSNNIQQGKQARNVHLHHNTILNSAARGIRWPAGLLSSSIVNNVALGNTGGDFTSTSPTGITFKKNAYNNGIPSGAAAGSFVQVGTAATELTNPTDSGLNLYPKSTSALRGAGATGYVGYDFDFRARNTCGPTIGAYEYISGAASPRWTLAKGIKVTVGSAAPCGATCTTTCSPNAPSGNTNPPTTGTSPTGPAPTTGTSPTGPAPTTGTAPTGSSTPTTGSTPTGGSTPIAPSTSPSSASAPDASVPGVPTPTNAASTSASSYAIVILAAVLFALL